MRYLPAFEGIVKHIVRLLLLGGKQTIMEWRLRAAEMSHGEGDAAPTSSKQDKTMSTRKAIQLQEV